MLIKADIQKWVNYLPVLTCLFSGNKFKSKTCQQNEKESTEWEKIFADHICDKRLYSKYIKNSCI